jgi:hypothetical protein
VQASPHPLTMICDILDTPGSQCAHALPLEKGEFVDAWSCSPTDLWRAVRYKARDETFLYGSELKLLAVSVFLLTPLDAVVPSHYLESRLKRPRLFMNPIVVSLSSKKKASARVSKDESEISQDDKKKKKKWSW